MLLPTGFGKDPGPARHRRTVPNMLPMPARQIRNPIAVLILMVSNNRLLHVYQHTNETAQGTLEFLECALVTCAGRKKRPFAGAIDVERSHKYHVRFQRAELD
jgi:hypothetical protein